MPYSTKGKLVLKEGHVIAHAKSPAAAKKQVNLLRAVEHGWKPTGKQKK